MIIRFDIPPERLKELYKRADVLAKWTIIIIAALLSIIFIVNNFDFIQEKILTIIKMR